MTYEEKKHVKKFQMGLRRILRGDAAIKHSLYKYLGCSRLEFRDYIEDRFLVGMTWDNQNKDWELGHIVPVNCFDQSKEDDLHLCWHYKNIIPMFCEDNKNFGSCILFAQEFHKRSTDSRYHDIINVFSKSVYQYIYK